jgi:phosphoribosylformylglycinamidine synthase
MNVGVVTFPGSNCDADARHAAKLTNEHHGSAGTVHQLWHKDTQLPSGLDLVILPGGFSYGDYLRTGAIARFSNIMSAIVDFASAGGYVLGICNGFQILCESGLLPGALIRNAGMQFVCKDVYLRVERTDTAFTRAVGAQQSPLRIPIAHGDGRYTASEEELDRIEQQGQVLFRYADESGSVVDSVNPNGSQRNIAGILSERGNVMGMMPHPERAMEDLLGSNHGAAIFNSLLAAAAESPSVFSSAQLSE